MLALLGPEFLSTGRAYSVAARPRGGYPGSEQATEDGLLLRSDELEQLTGYLQSGKQLDEPTNCTGKASYGLVASVWAMSRSNERTSERVHYLAVSTDTFGHRGSRCP